MLEGLFQPMASADHFRKLGKGIGGDLCGFKSAMKARANTDPDHRLTDASRTYQSLSSEIA